MHGNDDMWLVVLREAWRDVVAMMEYEYESSRVF
jgi:hypothetical protein